jgi:hypothetical protein
VVLWIQVVAVAARLAFRVGLIPCALIAEVALALPFLQIVAAIRIVAIDVASARLVRAGVFLLAVPVVLIHA